MTFSIINGQPFYSVQKNDRIIIRPSKLGFEIQGQPPLADNFYVVRHHSRSFDETWQTHWGEESEIRNNYNETAIYLEEKTEPNRLITIRFRIFDDGVAFRYEFPPQNNVKTLTILRENTEFAVDINSPAWWIQAYQPDRYEYLYQKTPISNIEVSAHTPFTIQSTTGDFIAIHEAALYDYGSMNLYVQNGTLTSDITPLSDGTKANVKLPFNTPWRAVIIAHSALSLTKSRMILNLNEPPAPANDFSWVEPTKFMGIWWALHVGERTWASGELHGANTENTLEYIDACKKLQIPALLLEGWNPGWDGEWLGNGDSFTFAEPQAETPLVSSITLAHKT